MSNVDHATGRAPFAVSTWVYVPKIKYHPGLTGPNGFIQVLIDLFKTRLRLWTGKYDLNSYKG